MAEKAVSPNLRPILEPVVTSMGLDLEDVQLRPAGRRTLVRVLVDQDGGVDLDTVAEASQAIGDVLDESNAMGESPYVLEVSSPGVDRPLTEARHWRRNATRNVKIELKDGNTIVGRIVGISEDDAINENNLITIKMADKAETETTINMNDVARAIVQVEFGRE